MNGRKKVTVVGAGNVGATCALEVARRDYADVVLVDIVPNFAAGKALDMNQMASVTGYEPAIVGVESRASPEGHELIARESAPFRRGLRARAMRKKSKAQLVAAKVPAHPIIS